MVILNFFIILQQRCRYLVNLFWKKENLCHQHLLQVDIIFISLCRSYMDHEMRCLCLKHQEICVTDVFPIFFDTCAPMRVRAVSQTGSLVFACIPYEQTVNSWCEVLAWCGKRCAVPIHSSLIHAQTSNLKTHMHCISGFFLFVNVTHRLIFYILMYVFHNFLCVIFHIWILIIHSLR